MTTTPRTRTLGRLILIALLLPASTSLASEGEHEIRVAPMLGFGHGSRDGTSATGFGFSGGYLNNLTDFWSVGGSAHALRFFDGDRTMRGALLGEARYVLDALRFVPWAGVGAGIGFHYDGIGGWSGAHPAVVPVIGLDLRPGRAQAYGLTLARHFVFEGGSMDGSFWSARLVLTFFLR